MRTMSSLGKTRLCETVVGLSQKGPKKGMTGKRRRLPSVCRTREKGVLSTQHSNIVVDDGCVDSLDKKIPHCVLDDYSILVVEYLAIRI